MQILNWVPSHAQQIRYTAPYYDEDDDGERFCVNEDEATQVWFDVIKEVDKTKRPMYYRRRTLDLARRDRHEYQRSIYSHNNWQNDWNKNCVYVRVKVVGRRVVFIHDEEFVHKNWITAKKYLKLKEKTRKFKEQKFKNFSKKILKDSNVLNIEEEYLDSFGDIR